MTGYRMNGLWRTIRVAITAIGCMAAMAATAKSPARYGWDLRPQECFAEPRPPTKMCLPRYPWDKRWNKCFAEGADPMLPGCKLEDVWTSYAESVTKLEWLFMLGEFELFERGLTDITTTDARFDSGNLKFRAATRAISTFLPSTGRIDGNLISRWKEALPSSTFVVIGEAMELHKQAWTVRGGGSAATVSPESWELFTIRLQQAEKKLLEASPSIKDTPLWHYMLLEVVLDSPKLENSFEKVFGNAIKRWPRAFAFYDLVLYRMTPKWGGSWEVIDAFIQDRSRIMESSEGLSMYARLYLLLPEQDLVLGATKMDWRKMKPSFADLVTRYPDRIYKNRYASFACLARDKAAFAQAMALLPQEELRPQAWLDGHSYDACMRWSTT